MVNKDWELCGASLNSELYKVINIPGNVRLRTITALIQKSKGHLPLMMLTMMTIVGRRTHTYMLPLYAFKIVTACVDVPLRSSRTATSDLNDGWKQRQHIQNSQHNRSLLEQVVKCHWGTSISDCDMHKFWNDDRRGNHDFISSSKRVVSCVWLYDTSCSNNSIRRYEIKTLDFHDIVYVMTSWRIQVLGS